ncbi:MAG: hypothetical protein ABJR05_07070 [Balneola sp.]
MKKLIISALIFFAGSGVTLAQLGKLKIMEQRQLNVNAESNFLVGVVKDAVFAEKGLIVIDEADPKVLFIQDNISQKIGNEGRGPMEYLEPTSVSVSNSKMALLDKQLNRISHFKFSDKMKSWDFENTLKLNLDISDVCEFKNQTFIYGLNENGNIHKLTKNLSNIEYSVGKKNSEVLSKDLEKFNNGIIECDENKLIIGLKNDNKVSVYSNLESNVSNSEIVFNEIVPLVSVIEKVGDRQRIIKNYYSGEAYNENGKFHDLLTSVIGLSEKLFLIQYERSHKDAKDNEEFVMSFIVDIETEEYLVQKNLPIFKDVVDNKGIITKDNELYLVEFNINK